MSRARSLAAAAAVLAASLGPSAPVDAQSITAITGLGYPALPTDARTQALGGLGIGLRGLAVPLINPAASADVARRGFVLAVENTTREMTLGDATGEVGATRFPLLRVLVPFRGSVISLGYGAFLDQGWAVTSSGSVEVGSGTLRYQDFVESTGGMGQLRLGVALPLGEDLAVGASVGAYTGSQRIRHVRQFDTLAAAGFERSDETSGWRYFGPTASIGARADLGNASRIGLSLTWSGTVSADSVDGRAADRDIDLPLQVAGGASAYLGPALLAAVSARWSGWSAAQPGDDTAAPESGVGTGRDTWEIGAGLELDDPASRATRHFPIRIGVQYRQLPFQFSTEAPTELFYGGGVGMRMGTDPANPVASLDLTIQRGSRTASGGEDGPDLEESAWRFALSLSLFGS